MKLIGNLKNKVDKAQNKEEAKEIIAQAGMLLDDDELDKVAGGGSGAILAPGHDFRDNYIKEIVRSYESS